MPSSWGGSSKSLRNRPFFHFQVGIIRGPAGRPNNWPDPNPQPYPPTRLPFHHFQNRPRCRLRPRAPPNPYPLPTPVPTISLPVVSLRQPRRPFRTGWVLLDSRFVPEEGRRCRPGPLVGVVASGFQRCHVPVHKDNILAGFGRTRVKLVVIEKERSRSRRKRQEEIGNSAGPVPLSQ